MLLVLVCLGTATVATTAYVTSRDNSAMIGANVADAAAARWAAASGLDVALATIQSGIDWRAAAASGTLIDSFSLAGADVDVELLDLVTQQPPNALTTEIEVHVLATVGSMSREATGIVSVSLVDQMVGVDLAEFAIFGRSRIDILDDAAVARWGSSPVSRSGGRVAIGTNAMNPNTINIGTNAVAVDWALYHRGSASASLVRNQSTHTIAMISRPGPVPVPAPPYAGMDEPEDDGGGGLLGGLIDVVLSALESTTDILADTVCELLELDGSSSVVTVRDATLVVADDVELSSGAGIIIEGDAKIVIFGVLDMDPDSYIELRPGARLEIFVRGGVDINNAYIGNRRASNTRDVSGDSEWVQNSVYLYTIPSASTPTWRMCGNSEVKASMYAPTARVEIEGTAALYGRVAAAEVFVRNSGAVFYDPVMDKQVGYTNPQSAIFDNGSIRAEFSSLPSLDEDELESLSATIGLRVLAAGELYGSTAEDNYLEKLDMHTVSYGTNVAGWEK